MKSINIKGKDYVLVNERVKEFRKIYGNEMAINCEIVNFNENSVLMRAEIKDKDGRILAVGHAHETANSSMINKTSMFENCETSAVGRALGFLGIGIDASIASADEVALAVGLQEMSEKQTQKKGDDSEAKRAEILRLIKETNSDMAAFLAFFKVYSVDEINGVNLQRAINMLMEKKNKKN